MVEFKENVRGIVLLMLEKNTMNWYSTKYILLGSIIPLWPVIKWDFNLTPFLLPWRNYEDFEEKKEIDFKLLLCQ